MASFTYKERLEAGLQVLGYIKTVVNGVHSWQHTGPNKTGRVYVGLNGGLRLGRTKTTSRSVGDPSNRTPFYTSILMVGDRKLAEEHAVKHHEPDISDYV